MTVKPDRFVQSMRERWSQEYGLKSSAALEQAWHEMATTFNEHIQGKITNEWSVLTLPTGSGKTQGLALYCSLLSEQSKHPGVLVITRFTDEVDSLVDKINQSPFLQTAFAEHSKLKKRLTSKEIQSAPVLTITHSMYKQTLNATSQNKPTNIGWQKYTDWEYGRRKLIVVDEALDVVEPIQVSHDLLRLVRGWIPRWMELENPEKISAFERITTQFICWEDVHSKEHDGEIVTADFWADFMKDDIEALGDMMCKLPLGRIITGRDDKGYMVKRCKEIFSDILFTLSNQSWYERKKKTGTLNTAYVALPTHVDNAVIMDATARQSRAYDLLGSIPNFRPMPDNVRNYKNVRLHVLYGYQNSTYHLMKPEQDEQHFVDVVGFLRPFLQPNQRFLFVTTKAVTDKLSKLTEKYRNCKLAHWGNINGKNQWSDCTALVIYGLPRLDDVTPQATIFAFENWHEKTKKAYAAPDVELEDYPDGATGVHYLDNYVEEKEYTKGHMAAEIIQAINRIQCRKVTDDEGGCPETDIYILFNAGDELEQSILESIKTEMNGIQIVESRLPSKQKRKLRSVLGKEIIVKLKILPKKEHLALDLLEAIKESKGIGSLAALKTFTAQSKKKDAPGTQALAEIGYEYHADVRGGKGNKGVFRPLQ